MKKRISALRPLANTLQDQYSRKEVFTALQEALFTSADQMDLPFIEEALAHLSPGGIPAPVFGKNHVWQNIQDTLAPSPRFMPKKLVITFVMLLLLLTTALALVSHYHSLTGLSHQDAGYNLPINKDTMGYVSHNLAAATFKNSRVVIEEALFDGQQLRIVYSVTDTRNTPQTFAPDLLWADGMEVEKTDNLTGILGHGSILVNGEKVYLEDTVDFTGDVPNQRKYYMGVTLPEHLRGAKELKVELPLHSRYHSSDPQNPKPDLTIDPVAHELSFTLLSQGASSHLNRKGTSKPVTIEGVEHRIKAALFSAVDGYIALEYDASALEDDPLDWAGVHWAEGYLTDMNYNIIATRIAPSWNSKTIWFHFVPKEAWPDIIILNGKDEGKNESNVYKIKIVLE